jgi:hypothetical protein
LLDFVSTSDPTVSATDLNIPQDLPKNQQLRRLQHFNFLSQKFSKRGISFAEGYHRLAAIGLTTLGLEVNKHD